MTYERLRTDPSLYTVWDNNDHRIGIISRNDDGTWTTPMKDAPHVADPDTAARMLADCPHPAHRLFTWKAFDGTLCVSCSDCGKPLKGAAAL